MKRTLEHRNPEQLKNHPKNAEIYGTIPDEDFVADIKNNGVLCPLLVTSENVVIGGHRRRQAAMIAKIKSVPVIVCHDAKKPDDVLALLLADNRYREKTNEQKAREFAVLKEIEEARAKERQKTLNNRRKSLVENVPQAQGKSRDKAAEEVGMSGKTAEKAAKVVSKIDEAEAAGDTETAEHLRETLNKSVSAAAKEIEPKPGRTKAEEFKIQQSKTVKTAEALVRAFDDLNALRKSGGHAIAIQECQGLIGRAKNWK